MGSDHSGWHPRQWGFHIDFPWTRDVRVHGMPMRAYIRTPWGWLQIGEKSQVYDRKARRYTDRYAYIVYRPNDAGRKSK